jgi:hypothetical protein
VAAATRNQIRLLRGEEAESCDEVRFLREYADVGDAGDVRRVPGVERQDYRRVGMRLARYRAGRPFLDVCGCRTGAVMAAIALAIMVRRCMETSRSKSGSAPSSKPGAGQVRHFAKL